MKTISSRSGFTLIEMLVASLLMGMLVTILTMIFNQSAIAWRTGKAGVAQMSIARRQLAYVARNAENALPRISVNNRSTTGFVLSPWDKDGNIRHRAVRELKDLGASGNLPSWTSSGFDSGSAGKSEQPWVVLSGFEKVKPGSGTGYIVGVHSWGPDGLPDTGDDISTWPEDVK